ncbi:arginine--tRNA ligase [Paenibacillus lactis]|uniref:Arginine--tRNA ligase n=1 Tax=Paenibacillus lactis TaxID=228574 RepID=A0ABS4FEJ9_9BACL|nr:arginine--tRNA ligase [Paenibacillus lactis]MBP1894679.1 arginyl-tRNA synthetase [Paenibacillus lactis]HAG00146.1 arginine--tRNA ligase [Paenibacillus lactis]
MLSHVIIESLEQAVNKVCQSFGTKLPDSVQVRIEQPASMEHGDYATNIAMQLAKVLRKAPIEIAGLIQQELHQHEPFLELIASVEVAAPGFLNLRIRWEAWAGQRFELPAAPDEKIVIEHTSINPNKSAHIGHLRNSCIGDTLVRLMRRLGYEVEVHNYIDDLGNQLADTVVGLLHTPLTQEHARFGDYCWDVYSATNRAYTQDPSLVQHRTEVLHALEEGHQNLAWIGLLVAERIVKEHLEEMKQFGIEYDLLVWESSIVREGFWDYAFELLKNTPLFQQETEGRLAGCWVLKQSGGEDAAGNPEAEHSMDKVLVRSNGILTYTAKDIAYHLWKYGVLAKDFAYKKFTEHVWTTSADGEQQPFGKASMVINVIDYRQQYPQAMVKQALESLGFVKEAEKLRHVSYGVVSLSPSAAADLGIDTSDGKASYAMSGRQGIGIKITELIDQVEKVIEETRSDKNGLSSREIAIASIRYYLLRFALQTEVVFDLKQATEISGNTGVYLLYSYARALSVLNKAKASGVEPVRPVHFPAMEKAEHALLRHISTWQDTLVTAGRELSPSAICNFTYELCSWFNNFYSACPILKAEEEVLQFRVWLTSVFKETLGDALDVLGLPTPSRM